MNEYQEILKKAAVKEITMPIVLSVILLILLIIIWFSTYLHFSKMKKKHLNMYKSLKQVKARKNAFWALIALSAFCAGLAALLFWPSVITVLDINKDIKENSYITYTGEYYIYQDDYIGKYELYDRWVSVELENGEWVNLYIDDVFEAFVTDRGERNGKLVYGKNSLIVVEMADNSQ